MENERVIGRTIRSEDADVELSLRPKSLETYIGQKKAKGKLDVFIRAAKQRFETLDHVLLYGPPGLGKTTLAHIISLEMGVGIRITSGPAIERQGDLASILTNLNDGDVLFIDEIHRLNRTVEEILYPAMEDNALDLIIGKGPSARSVRIDLPKFTLIGATTRAGLLSAPLRDRFGVLLNLELYDNQSLMQIVERSAEILGIKVDTQGAMEISKRARGTPRIANRLLKRVRDFAQISNSDIIDYQIASQGLDLLEIDSLGLDKLDRRILEIVVDVFDGGPVGIDSIAAATGEDKNTIEDVYEPYLIQIGFLARTARGRILTKKAYNYLGKQMKKTKMETCSEEEDI